MNFSFFLCLAAFRTRSSAWDTLSRICARRVLCWPVFPLVPALGSTASAAGFPALFGGFAAHMRAESVKVFQESSGVRRHAQSFLSRFSIQGLSPVARPGGAVSPRRSKLTYGRRSVSAAPTSRLRAVRTQGDVTSLQYGIESHTTNRFVRLGLPGMISFPRQMRSLSYLRSDQTAFMTAPSITTPAVTYFHNATSSFRAKAMIVALRRLSVLVRSRNHLLSADSG